jgi:hypothetical protein
MTRIRKIIISGLVVFALSACAVGIAQAMDGESDPNVTAAQTDRAERAALNVVKNGQVVSVAHDDAGVAAWAVKVFKPTQSLESFDKGPAVGRHIVVYLDRDFSWLQAQVEGYGPRN